MTRFELTRWFPGFGALRDRSLKVWVAGEATHGEKHLAMVQDAEDEEEYDLTPDIILEGDPKQILTTLRMMGYKRVVTDIPHLLRPTVKGLRVEIG